MFWRYSNKGYMDSLEGIREKPLVYGGKT